MGYVHYECPACRKETVIGDDADWRDGIIEGEAECEHCGNRFRFVAEMMCDWLISVKKKEGEEK